LNGMMVIHAKKRGMETMWILKLFARRMGGIGRGVPSVAGNGRPPKWEFVSHELRLKREAAGKAFEAAKDKDETIKSLEELRFLALSTKDLSDDDAYWIERKKAQIKAKLHTEMPMEPNNEDESDG
nr:hypothetical protein [Tanacetum cinerariifolium]